MTDDQVTGGGQEQRQGRGEDGEPRGEPASVGDPTIRAGRARVLIVDDERAILSAMRKMLRRGDYEVITFEDPVAALDFLREQPVDVMLVDLRLPHMTGLELLVRAKELRADTEVIMMTAYATVESAMNAVRAGAFDYLTKPFENIEQVILQIEKALDRRRLVVRARELERELKSSAGFESMIGSSDAMRTVFRMVESVAPTSANVLVQGETGTGKELIARAIHERSVRAHERLVTINCSALTETLLESELFGHKKGSFTGATHDKKGLFEAAHRGTLFLDEVGDMALSTQVKLLRALQDGDIRPIGANASIRVDVRVIAATHVDLVQAIETGAFREDLYWRLHVVRIELPPLRERIEDIPLLVHRFLHRACERFHRPMLEISSDAMRRLMGHRWHGNVRELENVIERAVVLCRGTQIEVSDFPDHVRDLPSDTRQRPEEQPFSWEMGFKEAKEVAVASFERRYCEALLEKVRGNVSAAAREAGLDRSNFRRLLGKHGIRPEAFVGDAEGAS
jgi:DNA-binding NtrC family response regulator